MLEKSKTIKNYEAKADIIGGRKYSNIKGNVYFENYKNGVLVTIEVMGLPIIKGRCSGGVFGFHIHEGNSCTGNNTDEFANTMMHYNPMNCLHPFHSGDLPPIFENNGYAYMTVFTDRFNIEEIIGKTVVIHSRVDDFTTQPSGNSGTKIACGVIRRK